MLTRRQAEKQGHAIGYGREDLRSLFRAHSSGETTAREFETWKKELLDWSKCHLNQTLPAEYQRITGQR